MRSCQIWVRVVIIVVIVTGENIVKSYFVGFAKILITKMFSISSISYFICWVTDQNKI